MTHDTTVKGTRGDEDQDTREGDGERPDAGEMPTGYTTESPEFEKTRRLA